MSPRKSAETGMVRVLYIGEPVGGPSPYRFMVQDPFLVHRIRMELEECHLKRNFLLSMIEFVSKFGANPSRIGVMLKAADDGLKGANDLYVDFNFEGSLARMEDLVGNLDAATEEALRIKDQTLLWICIVEWTAITGTSLVSGVVIWALMVRKRLYREVGATRSAR